MGNNKNQILETMNFLAVCLVAALASATHRSVPMTPDAAQLTSIQDDAKAMLNPAFLPFLTQYDDAIAAGTTPAEDDAWIDAQGKKALTAAQVTDFDSYTTKMAGDAASIASVTAAETLAKTAHETAALVALASWGAGTADMSSEDSAFGLAATGALLAAAALF